MGDGQMTMLASTAEKTGSRQIGGPLFRKYVGLFLAVVCVALLSNGLFEIYFSYHEHTDALVRIQREQAEGAAEKIGHFIKEIENQMGWTTQLTWSASTIEQRRFDGLRLLRQVPAVTELALRDHRRRRSADLAGARPPVTGRCGASPISCRFQAGPCDRAVEPAAGTTIAAMA